MEARFSKNMSCTGGHNDEVEEDIYMKIIVEDMGLKSVGQKAMKKENTQEELT
jgi:hypothetical protein